MKLEGAPLKPVGEPVSHSVSTSVLGEEKQSLEAASDPREFRDHPLQS